MKKLITLFFTFLLFSISFGQVDMQAVTVIAPNSPLCSDATSTITVRIKNNAGVLIPPIDYSVNNVTVTVNITGASTQSFSSVLTSGTLASQTTQNVILTLIGDLSAIGSHTFTISATVAGDVNTTNDTQVEFIVVEQPTISLTSLAATALQTVCVNTPITKITYLVAGGATDATFLGLPTGVSGVYNLVTKVVTISGTPSVSVGSPFNYSVTTSGGCSPNAIANGTITVIAAANAGTDGGTSVCDNSVASIDLFSLITGEQIGGVWTRITGTGGTFNALAGTFVPASGSTTSTFDYTITGILPCSNDVSTATITVSPTPVITGSLLGCIGSTTQLAGSQVAAGLNAWVSSDLSKATINNAGLITAIAAGSTNITYTTNLGCSITASVTINSIPTFTTTSTLATSCIVSNGAIDINNLNAATSYIVAYTTPAPAIAIDCPPTTSTGTNILNSALAQLRNLAAGNYTLFTVEDVATGCVSAPVSINLTPIGGITVNDIVDPTACFSSGYTLPVITGTSLSSGPANAKFYSLSGGTGVAFNAGEIINTTRTLYIYDKNPATGCSSEESFLITIDPLPVASAGGSRNICSTGSGTVSGASATNGTILWSESGAGSITAGTETILNPTYTCAPGDAGTITLTMTVTSNNSCVGQTAAATYSMIIEPLPTATITAPATQTICSTGSATVSGATATNGSILWTENGAGSFSPGTDVTSNPIYIAAVGDAGNTVTLTMTVTSSNSCALPLPAATAVATYAVVVNALPTAVAGGSQSICSSGTAVVSGASSTNGTIEWTENGLGSITLGATTLTPTYTPGVGDAGLTRTLTMTVTSNNSCGIATASAIYSVTIDPLPIATAGGSQAICPTASATVAGATSSNGSILWTENGAGSFTLGSETTLTPTYTSAVGDAGSTVTLTMTVTSSNACAPTFVTATYTVNVNTIPAFALSSSNLSSCLLSDGQIDITGLTTATSYDVTYTNPALTVVNTTLNTGGGTTLNFSALPSGSYTNFIVAFTSPPGTGCFAIDNAGVFLIAPGAINITDIVDQNSCDSIGYTLVTITGSNMSGDEEYYTQPNGGGAIIPVGSIVLANSTLYIYGTNAGCSDQESFTVTIDPLPVATITAPATQTICSTGSATVSGATATNGSVLWTENGAGSFSTGTDVTLNPIYNAAVGDAGDTVTLTMTVTSNNSCGSASDFATYTVIVDALPTALAGGTQTICSNSSATVFGASSTNGTIVWIHDGFGSITPGSEVTLLPQYNAVSADAGDTVNLTMTVSSNNSCTPAVASLVYYTVIIDPLPTAVAGGNQTICSSDTAVVSGASSTNGTIAWTENGFGSITAGTETTLTPTYTPVVGDAGNIVTMTMTVTSDNSCGIATSTADYTINVDPLPTATAGTTQTICSTSSATISGAGATNGSILWTIQGASGLGTLTNQTTLTPTYTPVVGDEGNTVSLTMTVTSNNSCGISTATAFTLINVVANPTVVLSSAINTNAQTVQSGTAIADITYTINGLGTAPTVTGLPIGIVSDFTGGIMTISGTSSVTSGTYFYVVSKQGVCSLASAVGSITINPGLLGNSGSPQIICSGESASLAGTQVSGGNGVYSYLWKSSSSIGGVYTNAVGLNTGSNYTTALLNADTYFKRFVFSAGFVDSLAVFVVTVNLTTSTLTLNAPFLNAQTLCLDTPMTSPIDYTLVGLGTVTATGLPAGVSLAFDIITGFYRINGTPSVAGSFNYTVTNTGSCGAIIRTGTLTVNNAVSIDVLTAPIPATICSGTSTILNGITPTGGTGVYAYSWLTRTVPSGPYSPAPGLNSSINYSTGILNADTYFVLFVTSGSCSAQSNEIEILMDPLPVTTGGIAQTICSNGSATISGFTGSNGTLVWTHNGTGSLVVDPTTFIPIYTSTILDAGKTITLTLTVTSNNACGALSKAVSTTLVTVNALPIASIIGLTSNICHSDSIKMLGSVLNGTASWTHNGAGVLSNSTIETPYYKPAVLDAGKTIIFNLTASDLTCTPVLSDTKQYILNVYALPTQPIDAGEDVTLSLGSSLQIKSKGSSIVAWNWKSSLPAISIDDEFVADPTVSPLVTTSYSVIAIHLNGCTSRDTIKIIVTTDHKLEVSNMMSPNGDGKNDTWGIGNIENYPNTEVIVVNREGEIVFEDKNYSNNWDGKYKGKHLPDATYYYIVKFADSDKVYKGAITLLQGSK